MASSIDYSDYSLEELLSARQSINEDAYPDNVAELDRLITAKSAAGEPEQGRPCKVIFSGNTREFFSIWIVNLLLSIATLGIYSAWAKVRTNRYFYGHTSVDGHRFTYLAAPLQILKGRVIAVVLFALYLLASTLSPFASLLMATALMFLSPWLVCKSLNFTLKMTGYRNVRFAFTGTYLKALLVFLIFPVLTLFTLYLALPWALKKMDEFIVNNTSFGNQKFSTSLRNTPYFASGYAAAFTAVVIGYVGVLALISNMVGNGEGAVPFANGITIVMMFLLYVAVFAVSSSIYHAVVRNHIYAVSKLDGAATFGSDVPVEGLLALRVVNLLAIVCSLGLAIPWAKIRAAHFYAAHTQVNILPGIDTVIATPEQTASSTADEVATAFDIDVALG
ncbi:YjgN family protein [Alteromonas gilva]|uniref:YjgN family protein n=1 Tax=Alteromonas gilva TaxID=2987522 RepID=A0ABT5L1A7_9ALTE|nr:YjgN family protein [Alteromonas gilva]MDC8829657.1 YjgN family protein [Alteromonas gilva]